MVGETRGASSEGRAYLFTSSGSPIGTLQSPSPKTGLYAYGWSVAVSGGRAVVSEPTADVSSSSNAGKAYVYSIITSLCIATATGNANACASANAGSISGFTAVSAGSLSPPPPSGLTFPYGLFSITISGLSAGQIVTVTITLSAPLPGGTFSYWKFQSGDWAQFTSASLDSTRTIITLTLTADSTGTINDPGGPAIFAQPTHPLNVGGAMLPLNLAQLLTPWIAAVLALTMLAVETLIVRKRKNRTRREN